MSGEPCTQCNGEGEVTLMLVCKVAKVSLGVICSELKPHTHKLTVSCPSCAGTPVFAKTLIEDYASDITTLNETVKNLRKSEAALVQKIRRLELELDEQEGNLLSIRSKLENSMSTKRVFEMGIRRIHVLTDYRIVEPPGIQQHIGR